VTDDLKLSICQEVTGLSGEDAEFLARHLTGETDAEIRSDASRVLGLLGGGPAKPVDPTQGRGEGLDGPVSDKALFQRAMDEMLYAPRSRFDNLGFPRPS
jgi:hypothetical protein